MRKCVYCNVELESECVVDVCIRCGHDVWGEQMFSAIKENMEKARDNGDLHQGSVTDGID